MHAQSVAQREHVQIFSFPSFPSAGGTLYFAVRSYNVPRRGVLRCDCGLRAPRREGVSPERCPLLVLRVRDAATHQLISILNPRFGPRSRAVAERSVAGAWRGVALGRRRGSSDEWLKSRAALSPPRRPRRCRAYHHKHTRTQTFTPYRTKGLPAECGGVLPTDAPRARGTAAPLFKRECGNKTVRMRGVP